MEPGGGGLPEAVLQYRPPATAVKKTRCGEDTLQRGPRGVLLQRVPPPPPPCRLAEPELTAVRLPAARGGALTCMPPDRRPLCPPPHLPACLLLASYDTLKAAGHRAADHIDMWRRHGSVYKTSSKPAAAAADPYEAIREALGKARRQELFSFAVAQLLVMGTPERAALLLRWARGGAGAAGGGCEGRVRACGGVPACQRSERGAWLQSPSIICLRRASQQPNRRRPTAALAALRPARPRSQDTGARLNYVLAALRPYMLELQAKASLKRSLE